MDAFWKRVLAEADAEDAELGALRDAAKRLALELRGQEALEENPVRRFKLGEAAEAAEAAEAEWRSLDPLMRALRRAALRERAYAGETARLQRAILALEQYKRGLCERDRRLGEGRWSEPVLTHKADTIASHGQPLH
jgi:hypothetical protein